MEAVVVYLAFVAANLGDETFVYGFRTVLGAPRPHVVKFVLEPAGPVRLVLGQIGYGMQIMAGAYFCCRFLCRYQGIC